MHQPSKLAKRVRVPYSAPILKGYIMDKRSFLKGLAALTAVAITPKAFKSVALAGTNISPIPKKQFFSYDPIAMAYINGVLNREVKLTYRSHNIIDRNTGFSHGPLVQPNPKRVAFYLEHDQEARAYFKTLPKREMPIEYWMK